MSEFLTVIRPDGERVLASRKVYENQLKGRGFVEADQAQVKENADIQKPAPAVKKNKK